MILQTSLSVVVMPADRLLHYTSRVSHVFVCFVDFTKAFDRVNYWRLLNQLKLMMELKYANSFIGIGTQNRWQVLNGIMLFLVHFV